MSDAPEFKTAMEFAYGVPRELAPGVVRIVANNPSPFTYKGTNTYVMGSSNLLLIDPGPSDEAHLAAILDYAAGRPITHVLITHTHRDHVDGLAALIAATGAKTVGFGPYALPDVAPGAGRITGEALRAPFDPDIVLADGEDFAAHGLNLTAIHTPGHMPDHHCFALEGTGVVFSGDHVMAWNTSVVAPPEGHMGDYLRSLEKMVPRSDRVFLPGHGGQLDNPQRMVRAFLGHRRMREASILECIKAGHTSVDAIVPIIYRGLDPRLIPAAGLSVLAHVAHLSERGLVRYERPLSKARDLAAV
jgi:glyoxylase-like metal-dependent hydrolase (beta-lactamase superfamily II)